MKRLLFGAVAGAVALGSIGFWGVGPASAAPPSRMAQPTVVAGDEVLQVSWSAPSSNGGNPVLQYDVVTSPASAGCTVGPVTPPVVPATSCTITGLVNGTSYTVTVTATNTDGTSVPSPPSVPRTPFTVPDAPSLGVPVAGNQAMTVTVAPGLSDGGFPILDYTVTAYDVDAGSATTRTCTVLETDPASPIGGSCVVTGLTNGTNYTFTAVARTIKGTSDPSAETAPVAPVANAPTAPRSLTAAAGNDEVTLTWSPPLDWGGPSGTYTVLYDTVPASGAGLQPVTGACAAATGSPCSVTAGDVLATPGEVFVFAVTATNGPPLSNTSVVSNVAGPVTWAIAPQPVTVGTATAGNARVDLAWDPPTPTGTPVTGYQVRYRINTPAGAWTTVSTGAETTFLSVTGLSNTTTNGYDFEVRAVSSAAGPSAWFTFTGSPARPEATFPASPAITSTTPGNGTVTITGPAVLTPTTAPTLAPYVYSVSWLPAGGFGSCNVLGSTYTCDIAGLSNGVAYTFAVVATNTGTTDSLPTFVTSTPRAVPSAPLVVVATAGAGSASLNWVVPGNTGGSAITGYTVRSSTDGGATWSAGTATGSASTSYTVTGLSAGTAYVFQVAAVNAAGTGPWSATSNPVTPTGGAPNAPTGVTGTPGNTTVALSWAGPLLGAPTPSSYLVRYSSNGGTSWSSSIPTGSAATSYTVTGLTNGTGYIFQVAAVNGVGTSGWSASSATITPGGAPGAPTGVTATAANAQATVSWSAPASTGTSAITSYTVTSQSSLLGTPVRTCTTSGTTCTVTGLTNGISYTFTVTATNAGGTGPASAASNAVTPGAVPGAPTAVTATAGDAQATVSWSAPADSGTSAITSYTVTSQSSLLGTPVRTCTTSGTTCTVTGLTNGISYTFTVRATNASGAGNVSAASNAVTPAAAEVRTIVIVGARTTVSGKPGVEVDGVTRGFRAGETVKPFVRFPGQSSYTEGTARPAVAADGTFYWSRKTGKKTYVYFTNADGKVRSDMVIIPAK